MNKRMSSPPHETMSHEKEETEAAECERETKESEAAEISDKDETNTSFSINSLALNPDFLSSFFIVTGGCVCLYLLIQEQFVVSPAAVANVAILWVASIGVGYIFQAVGIPPLLGSLVAGILLQNTVDNFELSHRFGETIETVGLCIILLISSTEIDVHAIASAGGISLRLTFLPGLVEAAGTAAASYWLFDMPPALALSLGFILAAVSPAIVIPGMTNLQRLGYGVEKGIPSLVMAGKVYLCTSCPLVLRNFAFAVTRAHCVYSRRNHLCSFCIR